MQATIEQINQSCFCAHAQAMKISQTLKSGKFLSTLPDLPRSSSKPCHWDSGHPKLYIPQRIFHDRGQNRPIGNHYVRFARNWRRDLLGRRQTFAYILNHNLNFSSGGVHQLNVGGGKCVIEILRDEKMRLFTRKTVSRISWIKLLRKSQEKIWKFSSPLEPNIVELSSDSRQEF